MDLELSPVIVIIVLVMLAWRMKFGFATVIVVQMLLKVVGVAAITGGGDGGVARGLLLGALAFWAGHRFGRTVTARPLAATGIGRRPVLVPDSLVWGAVVGASVLGVYHLIAGGVPIFSDALERERFSFTSSGMWGIPGRMYLFGIPIAWLLALANAHARGGRLLVYRPLTVATIALVITSLVGGFKGDILSLAIFVLASLGAFKMADWSVGRVVGKFWWAFALGILYFALTVVLYPSYASRGGSLFSQIYDRLTVIPAQPIVVALSGFGPYSSTGDIASDFRYYLLKYLGGDTAGLFSFERFVSAQIIGADPTSSAWTTPVIVGGYAELVHFGGYWLGLLGMLVAGVSLARLERASPARPGRKAVALVASWGIFLWVTKGGLAYYLTNFSAVIVIVGAFGLAGSLLGGDLNRSSRSVPSLRGGQRQRSDRQPVGRTRG